ncbi:MAG: hypothetical protein K0R98_724 [Rickettsiaceae bacterium]|jgi:hypothetical protein|nr:hypothetical protein [Rickettsiaceae bacterium]
MSTWSDFNSAEDQASFDLIPSNTLVKVRMTIKPGGFDDPSQGWVGGYATRSNDTGAIFLNAEFVIVAGPYVKRKVWSNIGLYSAKNDNRWGNMGRSFIRGILNSARSIMPKDESPNAQNARRINGFADLDGIEFVGKISMGKDKYGADKNEIQHAITPDNKEYAAIMGAVASASPLPATAPPAYRPPVQQSQANATGKPSWAQ